MISSLFGQRVGWTNDTVEEEDHVLLGFVEKGMISLLGAFD
jgi:hypothetical protein